MNRRTPATIFAAPIAAAVALMTPQAHAQPEPLVITESVTFEEGQVLDRPIVIGADGITIDGNGATLRGPGREGEVRTFRGMGISAEGRSDVTIRNINVHGWRTAVDARDGSGWLIEDSDFSSNYHDPDYGWGDGDRVGGIIFTDMSRNTIRRNVAQHNWNGLDLLRSHDNTVENNNFSHCSNVCLRMETASRNIVRDNDLSYGIRVRPGEVHARDSTSVLLESGSDDNLFERNDARHGGNGFFIRVLNGWTSRGNVFIENDASYANNNGFEAWSPENTYINNVANHCSYGFWLGGSDRTVLIGNEAGHNGRPGGNNNAPEPDFQHGGIVIVNGSGTHTIIRDNYCHNNNGGGIVFRGDLATRGEKWKMRHMIVQNNRLENNRWGLFARFTDWLELSGNVYINNEQDELLEEVTNLIRFDDPPEGLEPPTPPTPPPAVLNAPERATVGERVVLDASESTDPAGRGLGYRWDIGGRVFETKTVEFVPDEPGFYRVGLSVNNGHLSDMAYLALYVVDPEEDDATEGNAESWGWIMGRNDAGRGHVQIRDDETAIVGDFSVHMRPDPYTGAEAGLVYPGSEDAGWDLTGTKELSFWIRFQNPNIGGFRGPNPTVRLHAGPAAYTYTAAYRSIPRNMLMDLPYNEARHGWLHVRVPLEGSTDWVRVETFDGARPAYFSNGLRFDTLATNVQTQDSSAMVSDGTYMYLASVEGDRLFRSRDGEEWRPLPRAGRTLGGPGGGWMTGMLAYAPDLGDEGSLVLRRPQTEADEHGHRHHELVIFDLATSEWRRTGVRVAASHGGIVVDNHFYGIAHAVGGNYGGPISRVNLASEDAIEERSVIIASVGGWWFSRAAQLAYHDGHIYATKNDWTTPQPEDPAEIGDRLFAFTPDEYRPSEFAGGNPWDTGKWREARTEARDLTHLPFEVGHGSAVVPLPADWSEHVGAEGGLFIVAAQSPSNGEGYGSPSTHYAIYDIASGNFTEGELPAQTGSGTSAAFHDGKVYVKRGGMNFGPANAELWVIEPGGSEAEIAEAEAEAERQRMNLGDVDAVSIQFNSVGGRPFDIWIDGLRFE